MWLQCVKTSAADTNPTLLLQVLLDTVPAQSISISLFLSLSLSLALSHIYICIYIYTHTCIIYIYIYTCVYIYIYVCIHTCIYHTDVAPCLSPSLFNLGRSKDLWRIVVANTGSKAMWMKLNIGALTLAQCHLTYSRHIAHAALHAGLVPLSSCMWHMRARLKWVGKLYWLRARANQEDVTRVRMWNVAYCVAAHTLDTHRTDTLAGPGTP